jgi:hypothetical protein|tara:strand:+ start:648 stop:890 length:243 start_codon:yes stop_codon:yes gene_type:complete
MYRKIFSKVVMAKYFLYIVYIFDILNIKNKILIVLFFFNSFLLALLETLSIGILSILYKGFLLNTDLILSKIPIDFLQEY